MTALTPTQQARVQHARDMLAAHTAGGARQVATGLSDVHIHEVHAYAYGAAMAEVGILLAVIDGLTRDAQPEPCPHGHSHAAYAEQCSEAAARPASDALCCWLPEGHDGDHWDQVDRVHWHTEGDGRETPRRTVETPCEGRS